jgi:hypothetical protein
MLQTPRMQEGSDDSMTLCLGHEGQAGEIFAFFGGSARAVNCRLDDNRWRREGGRGCTHEAQAGRNQVRIAQTSNSRSKELRARVARVRGKLVVTSTHRRRVAKFVAPASCCKIGNNLDIHPARSTWIMQ